MPAPLTRLGDIDINTFLRDYWQQKPLLIRQAFPGFESPLEPDELAGLALEEEIESRIILEQGKTPWELRCGPFSEADFSELPESNWTLLLQAVDHYIPELTALLESFRFLPDWRLDDIMVSYAVNGGSVGPHFDQYDVFLLQGAGERHWQLGQLCGPDSALLPDTQLSILSDFQAEAEYVLQPGDMLYLPPRLAHWGTALDDDCITYSIGFRAPSHSEILEGLIQDSLQQLTEFERFNDGGRDAPVNPGLLDNDAIEQVLELWRSHINRESAGDWLGRHMTRPKYSDDSALTEPEDDYLNELPQQLQKHPASRFAWLPSGTDQARFFVAGTSHDCSTQLATALCAEHHYQIDALLALATSETDRCLLNLLWFQGHLEDPDDEEALEDDEA
ncbi:cupin domain-containing protein [Pseudomaricurvus sp. HS19]|uniref:cupin domain-containing protein n=1 Tax=Pseudomaricurvus sp. HS19 TaxID=2692626 RepID=UPI00136C411C|nr:cupin domain-containing protein [Pseudomaricurvus sp. HS19]MYM62212.1 cupin domain-containing protein [Pseudomaricurvus sp. HS19]